LLRASMGYGAQNVKLIICERFTRPESGMGARMARPGRETREGFTRPRKREGRRAGTEASHTGRERERRKAAQPPAGHGRPAEGCGPGAWMPAGLGRRGGREAQGACRRWRPGEAGDGEEAGGRTPAQRPKRSLPRRPQPGPSVASPGRKRQAEGAAGERSAAAGRGRRPGEAGGREAQRGRDRGAAAPRHGCRGKQSRRHGSAGGRDRRAQTRDG